MRQFIGGPWNEAQDEVSTEPEAPTVEGPEASVYRLFEVHGEGEDRTVFYRHDPETTNPTI